MQSTKLYGYRIYRYSEIKNSSVIVALSKKNTEKVRGGLRDNSYFYICHEWCRNVCYDLDRDLVEDKNGECLWNIK